jgi:hypothetical protein
MEQLALTYEGAVNEGSHLKQVARPPSTALQVSSNKMGDGHAQAWADDAANGITLTSVRPIDVQVCRVEPESALQPKGNAEA